MLLARVVGEQEISLQPVAQVWVTHREYRARCVSLRTRKKTQKTLRKVRKSTIKIEVIKKHKKRIRQRQTETDPQSDRHRAVLTKKCCEKLLQLQHSLVQLKSHQAIKKEKHIDIPKENPAVPETHTHTHTQTLKVSQGEQEKRAHTRKSIHIFLSPSLSLSPALPRPVGLWGPFALLWFFTVSREKNSHFYFFIFIWAQKKLSKYFR